MAQLNTRGTLVRSRWDYFEHSNGYGFTWGSSPGGLMAAYLENNSSGAAVLDIFTLEWSTSVATPIDVFIISPPMAFTVLAPLDFHLLPNEPTRPALPGIIGMYTNSASYNTRIYRNLSPSTSGTLAPIAMGAFLTLPPGFAVAVQSTYTTGPWDLSLTVWYQYILDNIAPAK